MTARRRSSRKLEDLPSLFDALDTDAYEPVPAHAVQHAADNSMDLRPENLARPRALRFISLGSGSSGNCAYLGNDNGGILIDAGVDNNTVTEQLHKNGIDPAGIAGIVLTHDHNDHVRFAYAMLRRNRHMLLYCTPRTLGGLLRRHNISRRIKDYHKPVYKEFAFSAGGFEITPFDVSHDGTDNVGFHITFANHTFVVATDMGTVTERAAHYIGLANYLMLESNYDLRMLTRGKYPEYLKARVMGERGHLDNADAARLVLQMAGRGQSSPLTHVFLCHLSADNNTPQTALAAVGNALRAAGITVGDASESLQARKAAVQLAALPRFDASPLYVFRR